MAVMNTPANPYSFYFSKYLFPLLVYTPRTLYHLVYPRLLVTLVLYSTFPQFIPLPIYTLPSRVALVSHLDLLVIGTPGMYSLTHYLQYT